MTPTTEDPEQIPPPPPFAVQTDLGEGEHDVDLGEGEQVLTPDTLPPGCEHLADYASLELYFRAQLEPEISQGCQWILDHLDYEAIRRRWESDGSKLVCESGRVYQLAAPEPDPLIS